MRKAVHFKMQLTPGRPKTKCGDIEHADVVVLLLWWMTREEGQPSTNHSRKYRAAREGLRVDGGWGCCCPVVRMI